jgi:hypothetical protein
MRAVAVKWSAEPFLVAPSLLDFWPFRTRAPKRSLPRFQIYPAPLYTNGERGDDHLDGS